MIEEILNEWAYRVDDGMPNPKNLQHIRELAEVLDEMGLSSIKNELIQNLMEAGEDKNFKNPTLNKVIKYTDKNGKEKEGKVGNLLRNPEDSPGRIEAEKLLPKDGTPERDAINNELGGEGQPNRDIEKEKEKKGEGEPKGDETQTATAFNPNTKGGSEYLKGLPDTDPAKPDSMKNDSEKTLSAGGVVYSVGGGYYADTPGGTPKYRKPTEEGVDTNDFRYILESEKEVVKKVADSGGEAVSLVVIGDDEKEEADDAVKAGEFAKLTSTQKAKVIAEKIAKDDESFNSAENKDSHTVSLIETRSKSVNKGMMLPPGNTGSSFAENNGVFI
jgi:hypothetical protein